MKKTTKGYYVIPESRREAVNTELDKAGLGPDFFSIPIVVGQGDSATHYAASCSLYDWQQDRLNKALKTSDFKQSENSKLSRAGFSGMLDDVSKKEKKPIKVIKRDAGGEKKIGKPV